MSDLIRDIEETKPANGDTLPFRVVKVPGKNQRRIIDAAGCVIATVYNYTPGREGGGKTMKAHARLFANAPYMLKALKSALPQLEESLKQGGPCDHDVGICACDLIRAITAVKESIGAAEGTV